MKKLIFYIIISLLLVPAISKAAIPDYKLLAPLPCIDTSDPKCSSGGVYEKIDVNGYIGYMFKFGIALAVFLAVVMIIWGGFEYMFSEVPFIKTNGKDKIWNAVWGLSGALASYLLLSVIDPRLVQINTNIPPIKIDTSGVAKFKQDLIKDVSKISAVNQKDITVATNNIDDLKRSQEILDEKFKKGEIDEEEYNIETLKNKAELNKNNANIIQITTTDKALQYFNEAITTLNKDSNIEEIGTQIENKFKESIDELKKSQNFVKATLLENQKKFLIEEIKEESDLQTLIRLYKPNQFIPTEEKILKTKLDTYQKEISVTSSDPEIDYIKRKILKNRVDVIKKTLNIK